MIGVALRTNHCLDLPLPSIVWKQLLSLEVDQHDLYEINQALCQAIRAIEIGSSRVLALFSQKEMNRETFEATIDQTFTALSSDGNKIVELKEGGQHTTVTWENRKEYTTLLLYYYLNEFHLPIQCIRAGMARICPLETFHLFTWEEFEFRVCGNFGLDLELLKRHTVYKTPLTEESPLIIKFWAILHSLSFEEQTLFLRFVWGRSKLPTMFGDVKFQIHLMDLSSKVPAFLFIYLPPGYHVPSRTSRRAPTLYER